MVGTVGFMGKVVFGLGVLDAVLIMAFGIAVALMFLLGRKETIDKLWDRVAPAIGTLVGCSVAAAIVLFAIRFLLGMGVA